MPEDYRRLYDLESYLFGEVNQKFTSQGSLSTFDFFCIVIWKAERAKSKIAARLRKKRPDLDEAVREVTKGVANAASPKAKLSYLMSEWKLRLPMASAILTVLYPEEFTVYDERVRSVLSEPDLTALTDFDRVWAGYEAFKQRVVDEVKEQMSLRDKDRYLWAKSFHDKLEEDVKNGFKPRQGAK